MVTIRGPHEPVESSRDPEETVKDTQERVSDLEQTLQRTLRAKSHLERTVRCWSGLAGGCILGVSYSLFQSPLWQANPPAYWIGTIATGVGAIYSFKKALENIRYLLPPLSD